MLVIDFGSTHYYRLVWLGGNKYSNYLLPHSLMNDKLGYSDSFDY